ncbi:DUF4275 family protein [Paenibacillus sp. MBLB4367]|uniref:DUF4275 family protein n=1 Tax=Paenibacillus sp. MBLB4367 TaxID=3384767 RepID=UPI003907EE61
MDLLSGKKVQIQPLPNWGVDLRKQWENNFANHLTEEEKTSIFLHDDNGHNGYLWHLFSYKKRGCLKGEDADREFNQTEKNACYVFYQRTDDALLIEHVRTVTADDFLQEKDIYIVDTAFHWTYVITHETGWCGPYFSYRG